MSTPAGWYDDGSGRQRWWDGGQWTEHFADQQPAAPSATQRAAQKTADAFSSLTSKPDLSQIEGTLWSAVGKPLTGIGAGRYRVTEEYLIVEKGSITTKSLQIRLREIHDVDAKQTMSQKARGVGTITLQAKRPGGDEVIQLEDIPNFRDGVEVINRLSDEARHRHTTRENTSHVNYAGAAPALVPAAAPASAPAVDINGEIARLAEFHKQGVIDDEEFAAGKRRLLGL